MSEVDVLWNEGSFLAALSKRYPDRPVVRLRLERLIDWAEGLGLHVGYSGPPTLGHVWIARTNALATNLCNIYDQGKSETRFHKTQFFEEPIKSTTLEQLQATFPELDLPSRYIPLAEISDSQFERMMQILDSATRSNSNHIITALPSAKTSEVPERTLVHDHTMSEPTNTILYGPPGTGKTYRTAQMAVEICDGHASIDRAELMQRYEALYSEGRISFVTFHQSYGYEDFVEGLRPLKSEGGGIMYDVLPGVFKKVVADARVGLVEQGGLKDASLSERPIYKMSLGAADSIKGNEIYQASIVNGCVLLGWGHGIDFTDCTTEQSIEERVREELPNDDRLVSHARFINVFKNELDVNDIIVVSKGNTSFRAIGQVTGDYEFLETPLAGQHQMRKVRWLAVFDKPHDVTEIYNRTFTMKAIYQLKREHLKFDGLAALVREPQTKSNQPFVLIIDEINRANISKVFGELITLIEPDKRAGQRNAVTVRLPYSGEDFSVPSNLHLIGTMNTADRSIALLDTALRRRFEFEELQPQYGELLGKTIDGIDPGLLLKAINERVEFLYDRDHTIGHAYLLNVKDLHGLDRAFRRKIIPLLQEYFYEDWAKVKLVLNDSEGRFITSDSSVPDGLADIAADFEERTQYHLNDETFGAEAFLNVYTKRT